jgi:hypothetical protein
MWEKFINFRFVSFWGSAFVLFQMRDAGYGKKFLLSRYPVIL